MKVSLDPAGCAWAALISALAVAAVTWIAGWWLPSIWWLDQSRHWPVAAGTVEQFGIQELEDEEHDLYTYWLRFRIRYEAGGASHTCEELRMGREESYGSAQEARLAWAKIAAQGPVQVHYDPEQPTRAVVLPGASPGELRLGALLVACLVWLTLAVPHLVWVQLSEPLERDRKQWRQRKESAFAGLGCSVFFLAGVILFVCWIAGLPWPSTSLGAGVLAAVLTLLTSGGGLYVFINPERRRRRR